MIIIMKHWFPNFEPKHPCQSYISSTHWGKKKPHQSRGRARHMLGGTHTKDVNLLFIIYLIMYLAPIEHITPSPPAGGKKKRKEKKYCYYGYGLPKFQALYIYI